MKYVNPRFVIVLTLTFLLLQSKSGGAQNHRSLICEMDSFFRQTLIVTYGELADEQLYLKFFSDYIEKRGVVRLNIDREELNKINKSLFIDRVYTYFFPKIIFADEFESLPADEIRNSLIFLGKKDNLLTKYGVYLTGEGYIEDLKIRNQSNPFVFELYEYRKLTGIVSYFYCAYFVMNNPGCLKVQSTRDLIAVIFWKFLCDQSEIRFYLTRHESE
ncbi:hypothetical protein [Mangrovibacterium marinum]|uniref:Uncharacterized protein n=1 Tax=Mangrovibacterium marinum TaxID=1639118 RepID=A0A2T5C1K5_9BACT|nr:hypothetical protein [Mangrovibacterium marinum]PTN08549.1 hypothetical protein C8N47_108106 [Mangrovibacterium marinum]